MEFNVRYSNTWKNEFFSFEKLEDFLKTWDLLYSNRKHEKWVIFQFLSIFCIWKSILNPFNTFLNTFKTNKRHLIKIINLKSVLLIITIRTLGLTVLHFSFRILPLYKLFKEGAFQNLSYWNNYKGLSKKDTIFEIIKVSIIFNSF